MRPAPPAPTVVNVHTTTPEPTPSPTLKPVLAKRDGEISPFSPLPPPNNPTSLVGYHHQQQRVSVEPEPQSNPVVVPVVAVTQQEDLSSSPSPLSANPGLPYAPTPPIHANTPLRITSLEFPASKDTRPMSAPSRPVSMTLNGANLSFTPGPSVLTTPIAEVEAVEAAAPAPVVNTNNDTTTTTTTTTKEASPAAPQPEHHQPPTSDEAEDQSPFIPLTQQAIPLPLTLIPHITTKHTSCYTNHAQNIWSNNLFQPLGCMVCHENTKERKWSCTWCQLRICRPCSDELRRVPGRDVAVLVQARRALEEKFGTGIANTGDAGRGVAGMLQMDAAAAAAAGVVREEMR